MLEKYVIPFLDMTSWRMYRPHIGGFVHVFGALAVVIIAVFIALYLNRKEGLGEHRRSTRSGSGRFGGHSFESEGDKARIRILASLGWLMLLGETYKQLFYYFIISDRIYDFWFFPFQLCSVPMYLCILLPFVKDRIKSLLLTFMTGFTFVSAVAALIYPEDMLRPYVSLTAHGFIWHGILLFISLFIGFSGMADLNMKGFLKSALFYLSLCVIAIALNVALEQTALSNPVNGVISYPNMFYLSPYHTSNQPLVDIVESTYGRYAAMAAYASATILLAGISDFIFWLIGRRNR